MKGGRVAKVPLGVRASLLIRNSVGEMQKERGTGRQSTYKVMTGIDLRLYLKC